MSKYWTINSRKYIYWFPSNHVDGAGYYELKIRIKVRFLWWRFFSYVTVCAVAEYLYEANESGKEALLEKYKNRKKCVKR